MAAKSKARVIIARIMSTAGTGFFYTTTRLRTADRIVMRKYDPKVKQHVLFRETKK